MWTRECAGIFSEFIKQLDKRNVRYFILRNHEGLPDSNLSKDVDVVVDPLEFKTAEKCLIYAMKQGGCEYYDRSKFYTLHCYHGISLSKKFGIHVDLLAGFLAKGYEIYSFDEMYDHTINKEGMVILEPGFEALMIIITKSFGYRNFILNQRYRQKLFEEADLLDFGEMKLLFGKKLAGQILRDIKRKEFDRLEKRGRRINRSLLAYSSAKYRAKNFSRAAGFVSDKLERIYFGRDKNQRTVAVIGPDGSGKSTFIDGLIKKIEYYYVNDAEDGKCHLIHFRPSILPNLGKLGEAAGLGRQDTDFEHPHRRRPAGRVSSFFRMCYYMLDYIIGWRIVVRDDVRFDRYTVFDRYAYDFIVDPERSRIDLPEGLRRFMVAMVPKPQVVFVLDADPDVIYERKKELSLPEIKRQAFQYRKLANGRRMYLINSENSVEEMTDEAIGIMVKKLCRSL